ncbi:hypothetical protein Agub_g2029 [Astrephomene gubernaculifera]|uniref:Protein kinase domain-containing protein n=1 Tax=Astrephomene gubernaculifera TaxID=47775 RepID=A0AAD3HHC0_9CHLO|nr:hypothetical protein Agub_g2029 [Astrephomene gubernaculifera]
MVKLKPAILACLFGGTAQVELKYAEGRREAAGPEVSQPDQRPTAPPHLLDTSPFRLKEPQQQDSKLALLQLLRDLGCLEGGWHSRACAALAAISSAVDAREVRLYGASTPFALGEDDKGQQQDVAQAHRPFILLAYAADPHTTDTNTTATKTHAGTAAVSGASGAVNVGRTSPAASAAFRGPINEPAAGDDGGDMGWGPQLLPGQEVWPVVFDGGEAGRVGGKLGEESERGQQGQGHERQQELLESLPVMLGRMVQDKVPILSVAPSRNPLRERAVTEAATSAAGNATVATATIAAADLTTANHHHNHHLSGHCVHALGTMNRNGTSSAVNETEEDGSSAFAAILPLTTGKCITGALWIAGHNKNSTTIRSNAKLGRGEDGGPCPCPSLLTCPTSLAQLAVGLSMCLMGAADAPHVAVLSQSLRQLALAGSMQQLVGGLCDAVTAHVRQRFMLDPRVVAALIPEPSSTVGLMFSWGAADAASASAAAAAAATITTRAQSRLMRASTTSLAGINVVPAAPDGEESRLEGGMEAVPAQARPVAALLGAETLQVLGRVKSETTAQGTRRGPAAAATSGRGFGRSCNMERGEVPPCRSVGRPGSVSRVVALTEIMNVETLAATGVSAFYSVGGGSVGGIASGSCVALHVKPFPLAQTLLKQLVRKGSTVGSMDSGGGVAATAAAVVGAKATTSTVAAAKAGTSAAGATSSRVNPGGTTAHRRKALATVIENCAMHVQDPRQPSRDILMLLANANLPGIGGNGGGGGASTGSTEQGSSLAPGHHGGLTSLILLALPVVGSGGVEGKGMLGLYVTFAQRLPQQLLLEAQKHVAEMLEALSPVVSWKMLHELSLELETLTTASPGLYAVLEAAPPQPPPPTAETAAAFLHGSSPLLDSRAFSPLLGGRTRSQLPQVPPRQLQQVNARNFSLSQLPGSTLGGLMSARTSACAAGDCSTDGGGGDEGVAPMYSTMFDSSRPPESNAHMDLMNTGLGYGGGGGGELGTGTLSTMRLWRRYEAVAAASATTGPVEQGMATQTGGGAGGGGGGSTRSASVIVMEEMDTAHNTLTAQMPLLVASLQEKINSAKAGAAAAAAAALAAIIPSSNPRRPAGPSFGSGPQRQRQLAAPALGDLAQIELHSQLGFGGCAVVFKGALGMLDCAIKLMEMPEVDDAVDLNLADMGPQYAGSGGGGTATSHAEVQKQQLGARRALLRNAMELAVTTCISHPNIMQVYSTFSNVMLARNVGPDGTMTLKLVPAQPEAGKDPGSAPPCTALVCEWCDRGCLGSALARRTFPEVFLLQHDPNQHSHMSSNSGDNTASALRVLDYKGMLMTLLDVAMALRHLHSHGLIHRDVKPANVLLRSCATDARGFTAKLADFGFATLLDQPGDERSGGRPFAIVEESCGTVTHMAPECWSQPCRLDASCDVYSFGILMWELTAGGVRPYLEVAPANIPRLVLAGMRPVFHESVSPAYRLIAQRCWAADPSRRPRSSEVVTAVQRLLTSRLLEPK